jgi:SAM-dependent methyltransferase
VNSSRIYKTNNIYVPGLARPEQLPEERVTGSLNRGRRSYSDKEVAELPAIASGHPHYPEWRRRERSCRKLVQYLANRKYPSAILEVGCGNGWLSAQLSTVPGSKVVGIDPDLAGLQQAARVFCHLPNLKFIYGDFCSDILHDLSFDIIVFADSIQYFPSLRGIVDAALQHLRRGGELHILDTCFCKPEVAVSTEPPDTSDPPAPSDPPDAAYTFHHCIRDLQPFRYRCLDNSHSLWNRIARKKNPFPWIAITL